MARLFAVDGDVEVYYAVIALGKAPHLDGRAVRYLLIKAQKQLFAHKLRAYLLFRLVAYHIIREKLRAGLRVFAELGKELVQTFTVFGRHWDNGVKIMRGGIDCHDLQKLGLFNGVYFIYDEYRGNTRLLYAGYELFLLTAYVGYRLDEQHNGVDISDAFLYDVHHIIAQARSRLVEARGIYYDKLRISAVYDGADAVSRCLRLVRDYRYLLADQRACER